MSNVDNNHVLTPFDFLRQSQMNMQDYIESRSGFSYISWARMVMTVKQMIAARNLNWEPMTFQVEGKGTCLWCWGPNQSAMVAIRFWHEGISTVMWMPVIDHRNRAISPDIKPLARELKDRNGNAVAPETISRLPDAYDVNTALMRCLTKGLSVVTGVGLYVYCGENLPPVQTASEEEIEAWRKQATAEIEASTDKNNLIDICGRLKQDANTYGLKDWMRALFEIRLNEFNSTESDQ